MIRCSIDSTSESVSDIVFHLKGPKHVVNRLEWSDKSLSCDRRDIWKVWYFSYIYTYVYPMEIADSYWKFTKLTLRKNILGLVRLNFYCNMAIAW
jgi:hypothetical protein